MLQRGALKGLCQLSRGRESSSFSNYHDQVFIRELPNVRHCERIVATSAPEISLENRSKADNMNKDAQYRVIQGKGSELSIPLNPNSSEFTGDLP